jgi:hypothetical protein
MILELHFTKEQDDTKLAAWECLNEQMFISLKKRMEDICNKYSSDFIFEHQPSGNSLFTIKSSLDDFNSIKQIMNIFAHKNDISILIE